MREIPFYCRKPKERLPEWAAKTMSDLWKYITKRRKTDAAFDEGFDKGYQAFKIGVLLKQAREASGLTQQEVTAKLHTRKSAISRIENHAEDFRLSTVITGR